MEAAGRADVATRFQPGNTAALRHGAFSEPAVRRLATVQKRRLLRQIGLRAGDLDGLGVGYLDAWARAQSKVELLDQWYAEHGFLTGDGSPAPSAVVYYTSLNAATRTLAKLENYLRQRQGVSPTAALQEAGRRARELRAV